MYIYTYKHIYRRLRRGFFGQPACLRSLDPLDLLPLHAKLQGTAGWALRSVVAIVGIARGICIGFYDHEPRRE